MNNKTPNARWIRFNEETNALDYLEKAYFFIKQSLKNPTAWKWVIICLHGALYGFAVSACRGTNYKAVTHNLVLRL